MKQVCLDNHVIIWGIREWATNGQEDMIPRTKEFFVQCKRENTKILIPAVVLGEFLTALDDATHTMVVNLIKEAFVIAPYDAMAATIFAKLWRKKQALIDRLIEEDGIKRQELKADCMIVATAIAHRATAIYSHDKGLTKFANGEIPVLQIPRIHIQESLDLPAPAAVISASTGANPGFQ